MEMQLIDAAFLGALKRAYDMKKLAPIVGIALVVFGIAFQGSLAADDRFSVWENMMADSNQIYGDGDITDQELNDFQDVLRLGIDRKTDKGIKLLNEFLRKYRNPALREITKEAMQALVNQRKEIASFNAKHAHDAPACTLDLRICPDGTVVGREGRSCAFVACPAK